MAGVTTAAAAPAAVRAPRLALPAPAREALAAYAQVLFSDHPAAGALLLGATLLSPRVGLTGLAAVLLARATAHLLRLGEAAGLGRYGYAPLLVGLALGAAFEPSAGAAALLALAVVATVFLEAALSSLLGAALGLPVLSLPFVLVTWLALAAAPHLPVVARAAAAMVPAPAPPWLPELAVAWLRSLGAIFFSPTAEAGLLVAAALVLHSRIALTLSLVGLAASAALTTRALGFASDGALLVLHLNAMLAAVALGGVWFVPQRSAFALAAVSAVLTTLGTAGALELLRPLGLPVLILPFNVTMLVVLAAMRQRVRDGRPKAVDFAAGTPEANLAYYRTRLARFGPGFGVRFAPPFAGRWVVTQGVDGLHTHRGPWRHALDFEVADATGARHAGAGRELRDWRCYRLPVLAAADGTVVKVVADVPDNPVGERNAREPWGNVVVLQHGPALFSVVAHLAPGSIDVREGQVVRQGARLGLCGNSGRSFVPHLHFQLQASARVGAPTLELTLADVVTGEDDAPRLHRWLLPAEGASVRGLARRDELAAPFALPIGRPMAFEVAREGHPGRREVVTPGIGLHGELWLAAPEAGATLWYESQGRQFVVYDVAGRRDGVLHLLAAAAPRVPYELPEGLAWDDVLPPRRFHPAWARWALDLAAPFLPDRGVPVTYRARREGGRIVVDGVGEDRRTPITTRAVFGPEGPVELEVRTRAGARRAVRVPAEVADGERA